MVLEKIEVQGSFQDGISAGIQKTIDKMGEFQVSTDAVTQALERLNKAKDRNTKASQSAAQATADLVTSCKELEDITKEQRVTLHKIEIQTQKTGEAFVKAGESINDTFSNEVRARIQNALDTMVEFGATIDDVEAASLKLSKAQLTGTRGMAQQANVLRTLADESENAEFALANMGRATDIAAKAGIKLEDAGRQLGMAFRGDATILKNFDEQAKRTAAAIEKINDPAQRQKLIMEELERAQKRVGGTLDKLKNNMATADAKLARVNLSVKKLALGFAGLGVAVVSVFGFKALKAYTDGSEKMRKANKKIQKSIKDLKFALGQIVAQAIGLGDGFKGADKAVVGLTKTLQENRVPIAQAIRDVAHVSLMAAQAITMPLKGLALLFATVQDGFTELARAGTKLAEGMLHIFVTFGRLKEKVPGIGLSPIELKNIKAAEDAIKQIQATSKKVRFFDRTQGLVEDFEAVERAIGKIDDLLSKPVKSFKVEKRTDPKKKGKGKTGDDLGGLSGAFELTEQFNENIAAAEAASKVAEKSRKLEQELMLGASQAAQGLGNALTRLDGLGEKVRQQVDLARQMKEGYRDAGAALTQFANGGVTLASNSVSMLFENLASGQSVLANFGTFLLQSMSDLLGQMGQAFIMLGAGVSQIQTGLLSPGALIAIGVGMVALSGALKGFAARSQAGGSASSAGGGTAQALERFGQRLFDRGDADQGREMTINIEGRSMRGFMLDVAADGARRGSVPLTPRRV